MATGPVFQRRLHVLAGSIARNANEAVRKAALLIDQTVVMATPVDTGRARSNWVVTIGAPYAGTIEPYAPGSRLGVGEGANAAAAMDQGNRTIATRRLGEDIYITNNVDYIGKLNVGHSPQAPKYFVQTAIFDAISMLQSVRLLKG